MTDAPPLPPGPWAKVRRLELIRRQVRETIPAATLELLLERAAVELAGPFEPDDPEPGWVGLTLELAGCRDALRGPIDPFTVERVAELLCADPTFFELLERRLRRALGAQGRPLPAGASARLQPRVQAEGTTLRVQAEVVISVRRRTRRRPHAHGSS